MLEVMSNGTTKAKILENNVLTTICQDTVGYWIINLGFKYYCAVNSPHTQSHLVEYHVNMLPQFQDILEKIDEKGNFGDWLSIRMNLE